MRISTVYTSPYFNRSKRKIVNATDSVGMMSFGKEAFTKTYVYVLTQCF